MATSPTDPSVDAAGEGAETARQRSSLYGLLAAIFRAEPTAALLREIHAPAFQQALEAAGVPSQPDTGEQGTDDELEELAVEYTRLFIGPGEHVAPYAAIYLGGEGASLWGPETAWVKAFIEAAGFGYRPDYHDLPDHVSVELEFMQEITAREAQALDEGDAEGARNLHRLQREFLTEHMDRWVPKFCRRIEAAAERPLYKGIAALTRDFIASEAEALSSDEARHARRPTKT